MKKAILTFFRPIFFTDLKFPTNFYKNSIRKDFSNFSEKLNIILKKIAVFLLFVQRYKFAI